MSTATADRYMSYQEAEALTGLHRVTLWRWTKRGLLRTYGPRAAPRFLESELREAMDLASKED